MSAPSGPEWIIVIVLLAPIGVIVAAVMWARSRSDRSRQVVAPHVESASGSRSTTEVLAAYRRAVEADNGSDIDVRAVPPLRTVGKPSTPRQNPSAPARVGKPQRLEPSPSGSGWAEPSRDGAQNAVPEAVPGPVGFAPDPYGRFPERFYDGFVWTDRVRTGGREFTDEPGC